MEITFLWTILRFSSCLFSGSSRLSYYKLQRPAEFFNSIYVEVVQQSKTFSNYIYLMYYNMYFNQVFDCIWIEQYVFCSKIDIFGL